jgi:hypothetical protein
MNKKRLIESVKRAVHELRNTAKEMETFAEFLEVE